MPWQQPDSLRGVLDSVFAAPAYRWVEQPDAFATLRRWQAELQEWFRALRESNPLSYRLILYAMIFAVVLIVLHSLWVLYRTIGKASRTGEVTSTTETAPRTVAWFQHESERLAAEGKYAEAIQADFLALVLTLDASKMLRFHPSKTPAEYANESELPPRVRAEFRELVHRVYGYAFARWPCGPAEYAQWRAQAAPERYAAAH
jgi:hypothetical protein